jgi:hypothetical protein
MSSVVGADIKAKCGKCKLNTWHVVLAKMGDAIARVQCKSCGAQHKYRSPDGSRSSGPATRRRASGSSSSSSSSSSSKKKAPAEVLPPGPIVDADLSKPIRPYSARDSFAIGERVDHIKFGIGVVETLEAPGKMIVCFADKRRVLATAKQESSLARPENRTFDT